MKFPSPKLPSYDIATWQRLPFAERLKLVCQAWALDGYGAPAPIYIVYILKIALYVGAWFAFCALTPSLGTPGTVAAWWWKPEALLKALLWSMAFEGLGLGCGSGPLTGRYFPPLGGVLHFARPGTLKLPLIPGLPLLGGDRRNLLHVGLYLAHYVFLFRALLSPQIAVALLVPTAILLPLLGLVDKTIFLASRAEHYYAALICFLFPADALPGAKAVWLAIWWWAATSKLNRHFPSVVCVMTSNSPVLRFAWLRKRMYRGFPDDLRPSRLARLLAHAGTIVEYGFPLLLVTSTGGTMTTIGLCVMFGFHLYITSNIPMAVPIEWNVIMVYGAFVLFGHHAAVRIFDLQSPLLLGFLLAMLVLVPIVGNLFPRFVSFLCSMRYYAGNWAYSIWLFKGDSARKLNGNIVKSAALIDEQLARFYDEPTSVALISKVMAFRAMHLHGRALRELIPRAVDDIDAYTWLDGELVCGVVMGWNFGDGHLHDEQLLRAIQARCHFEPDELRCIFVESQPFLRPHLPYRIVDANRGELARGRIDIDTLIDQQPWPAH
jgi:hypothetical protein